MSFFEKFRSVYPAGRRPSRSLLWTLFFINFVVLCENVVIGLTSREAISWIGAALGIAGFVMTATILVVTGRKPA